MDAQTQREWISRVLGIDPDHGAGIRKHQAVSVAALAKARQDWVSARAKAVKDIAAVRTAVGAAFAGDLKQRTALAAALKRIDGLAQRFDATLESQMDAVLAAPDEGRLARADDVRQTLKQLANFIDSDPLMTTIDANRVTPGVRIAAPIKSALAAISGVLG